MIGGAGQKSTTTLATPTMIHFLQIGNTFICELIYELVHDECSVPMLCSPSNSSISKDMTPLEYIVDLNYNKVFGNKHIE